MIVECCLLIVVRWLRIDFCCLRFCLKRACCSLFDVFVCWCVLRLLLFLVLLVLVFWVLVVVLVLVVRRLVVGVVVCVVVACGSLLVVRSLYCVLLGVCCVLFVG